MSRPPEDRLEQVVRDLQAGRRLQAGTADADDRAAIMAAAHLWALASPQARLSPRLRRRLDRQVREEPAKRPLLSRREALVAAISAAAGAAGLGVAARTTSLFGGGAARRPAGIPVVAPASVIDPRPGTWFDAGPLAALPEGQAVHFRAGAVPAVLFREGSSVRALSAVCTHLPCELNWNGTARTLDCPCHSRSFDLQGASVGDDYPLPPLPAVQVRVEGGRVQVLGA